MFLTSSLELLVLDFGHPLASSPTVPSRSNTLGRAAGDGALLTPAFHRLSYEQLPPTSFASNLQTVPQRRLRPQSTSTRRTPIPLGHSPPFHQHMTQYLDNFPCPATSGTGSMRTRKWRSCVLRSANAEGTGYELARSVTPACRQLEGQRVYVS